MIHSARTTLPLLACILSLLAPFAAPAADAARQPPRPNIIFVFTDDHGYADLGAQGHAADIRTPHLDRLAAEGARCTDGYATAPQCVPSRAGLMSGRYQTRFGVDANGQGPMPAEVVTIAERLRDAGYATGMIGKWHLDPNQSDTEWMESKRETPGKLPVGKIIAAGREPFQPGNQGFTDLFDGAMNAVANNFDFEGKDVPLENRKFDGFRIENQTKAALAFLERRGKQDAPFFLYLAYYGPHVPLEATPELLARFPGEMPERRRHALATIAAIDDGVGAIRAKLAAIGAEEKTLIFFMADNGAPLKINKEDTMPISENGWDGSINDPWTGEKGTVMEGGIRVPFLAWWKGVIRPGQVIGDPVITLDATATAAAVGGVADTGDLDGVNLIPRLSGEVERLADRPLFWRFWRQAAIREGKWKYLFLADGREWLFDMTKDKPEAANLIADHPEVARGLREKLEGWAAEQKRPGLPEGKPNNAEIPYYEHYLPPGQSSR